MTEVWTKTFNFHWYHEDTSHYFIHSSKHNICLSPMIFLFRSSILAILTDDMLVILQKLIHSTLIKKFVPIKLHQFLLTCKYQARICHVFVSDIQVRNLTSLALLEWNTWRVPLVEQELLSLLEHWSLDPVLVGFMLLDL
jgi:hypothetical protein